MSIECVFGLRCVMITDCPMCFLNGSDLVIINVIDLSTVTLGVNSCVLVGIMCPFRMTVSVAFNSEKYLPDVFMFQS